MGMIEHDFCLCRPLLFAANEIPLRPLKTLLCVITVEILLIDVGAHSRMGQLDQVNNKHSLSPLHYNQNKITKMYTLAVEFTIMINSSE